MPTSRLIVASARLPVTVSHRQEGWDAVASTGGLVTALKPVAERRGFTWIGWPGAHVPEADRTAVTEVLAKHGALPVFLSKAQIEGFYQSFSNGVLWPLFHNQPQRARFDQSDWSTYRTVNEMFVDAICKVAKDGDIVWVHDYQLSLVPELLRRRGVTCPIGYFLHIPFPSAETYRILPVREAILRGILGADLAGFHTYEYVSHFRNACLRVLGLESEPEALRYRARTVRLGVLPIGIDPAEIREFAATREARAELANLRSTYAGKKIIVGVDRLDYTKGIPEKLLAFEQFLRTRQKWRQKVVLIQVAAPSRTDVDEYKLLKKDVDELVGRINGRFSSPSSTPVVYVNQNVPRQRLIGLYCAADIALVTPVRDGMNLVALEYVAARASQGGTLILSEFAGAAHCMAGARLVNPYNATDVVEALEAALETENRNDETFSHMLNFVEENTSVRWASSFLERLEEISGHELLRAEVFEVRKPPLLERFEQSERPLLLLDYDGTLRAFVVDPNKAVPDARILDTLSALAELATVYVVSGRSSSTLEAWLGKLPIGLVCEHGLSIKPPGSSWQERFKVDVGEIIELVQPLFQDFCRRTPGSAIEYKKAALAWHYRAVDPEYGAFQAAELLALLEDVLRRGPYKILRGSRVLEVRHEAMTKARALDDILQRHPRADLLFCAGDDTTDEEMMAAIPDTWRARAITCWVGSRNPHAKYWCESNVELIAQLESLAELWQERRRVAPPRQRKTAEQGRARK